jgi:hypothetical protein
MARSFRFVGMAIVAADEAALDTRRAEGTNLGDRAADGIGGSIR